LIPAALTERDFRRFIIGYTLSLTGSAMVPVAIAFSLYARGAGAPAVSKMLAAESIPMVLLLLLGGAAADRFSRRTVMLAANLLCLLSQAGLAALLFSHHAPLPVMTALMACIGAGTAFYAPGRQGLIPQIVTPENLQSANAVLSIAQSSAGIAGPVAGGLLVAAGGGAGAIALDSLSYGISALILLSLTPRPMVAAASASLLTQLRQGWSAFISRTWLWTVVLQFAFVHLLVLAPIFVLGSLPFAHAAHGALGWGGLLSLFGVGAIIGSLVALRIKPRYPARFALLGILVFALMPASLAAGLPYGLTGACFLVSGAAIAIFGVLWDTIMQAQIPPELLARVSAYDMFGSVCLLPVGYLLAAPMADAFGRDGTLWMAAGFTIVSTLAVLMLRDVRELEAK